MLIIPTIDKVKQNCALKTFLMNLKVKQRLIEFFIHTLVVWWVKYDTQVDTKMPAFWCQQCRCGENVGEGLKTCWRRSSTNQNPARHRAAKPG
mgnify:CR=1 FL=1